MVFQGLASPNLSHLFSHLLPFLFILFSSPLLSLVYILQGPPPCQRASFWCAVLFNISISICVVTFCPCCLRPSVLGHLLFFSRLLPLLLILTIEVVSIRRGFVQAIEACLPIWGRRILCPPHSSNLHLSLHRT